MSKFSTYAALASAIVMMGPGTGTAIAQSGADFFNGKTINYIVGTDPGGVYDTNGRLVAGPGLTRMTMLCSVQLPRRPCPV